MPEFMPNAEPEREKRDSRENTEARYNPAEIEPKWQARWDADPTLYAAEPHTSDKPKFYCLENAAVPKWCAAHWACAQLCHWRCARAVYVDARA